MELLGDVGSFGDSVNLSTRKVLDLRRTDHRLINHFGHARWYSFVTWVKWKLIWVHLESVNLGVRMVHGLCQMYDVDGNLFGRT